MQPVMTGAAAPLQTFVEKEKETATMIQTVVEVWFVEWITVKALILAGPHQHLTAVTVLPAMLPVVTGAAAPPPTFAE